MKTVIDIIKSDLCNSDTSVSVSNRNGKVLSMLCDAGDILEWGCFNVILLEYFPISNNLYIYIDYPEAKR